MPANRTSRQPDIAYVAPFFTFVAIMAAERVFGLPAAWLYPVRLVAVSAVLVLQSRQVISFRASAPWASVGIGIAVFAIWIGPDALFGPAYRHYWLFENALTGGAASSAPDALRRNLPFVLARVAGCAALVPIVEELFWRGWLMRWLIHHDFLKVPLGTYSRVAFWTVAVLFASEHGPYWEVGLVAGIIYNWWLLRTRNLADCIVAHAVTNGLLSAYVLVTGQWQYWL